MSHPFRVLYFGRARTIRQWHRELEHPVRQPRGPSETVANAYRSAETACVRTGLSPRWGFLVSRHFSHGLRRGLHSYAAARLKAWIVIPLRRRGSGSHAHAESAAPRKTGVFSRPAKVMSFHECCRALLDWRVGPNPPGRGVRGYGGGDAGMAEAVSFVVEVSSTGMRTDCANPPGRGARGYVGVAMVGWVQRTTMPA
jgi:hypothetical protein